MSELGLLEVPPVVGESKIDINKTSQELRMLSSVTINGQITKIVMNYGSQLSELLSVSQMSQVSGLSLLLLSIIVTIVINVIEILEKILEKSKRKS